MQPEQRRDQEIAILASYVKNFQDGLPPPTPAELSATKAAHPNAFAAHQLLVIFSDGRKQYGTQETRTARADWRAAHPGHAGSCS